MLPESMQATIINKTNSLIKAYLGCTPNTQDPKLKIQNINALALTTVAAGQSADIPIICTKAEKYLYLGVWTKDSGHADSWQILNTFTAKVEIQELNLLNMFTEGPSGPDAVSTTDGFVVLVTTKQDSGWTIAFLILVILLLVAVLIYLSINLLPKFKDAAFL
jgi:hypothetical protein